MSTPRQDDQTPAGTATDEPPVIQPSVIEPSAIQIADVVSAVPGVAALSGGRLGGVGTYLPGRRVTGIVIRGQDIEVHVVGRYGVPVAEIAAEVRQAVEPAAGDHTVHVIIEDLA
jgi:uncharacterized alkaline shock family protein YloU